MKHQNLEDSLTNLMASYQKKLAFKPENASLFGQMAELYYAEGNLEEALSTCQQALQLQPDLVSASITLEKVLQALGMEYLDGRTRKSALDNWITVDAESVSSYPEAIDLLYKGEINGMLVKQVFSKAEIMKVMDKIENQTLEWTTYQNGAVVGSLLQSGIDKMPDLQEAAVWRYQLRNIFEMDFEGRVEATLSQMSNSRTLEIPKQDNYQYMPASLRCIYPHHRGISPHSDNEFFEMTDHLKQISTLKDSLSYFVLLGKPEKGGELIIYDLFWESEATQSLKKKLTADERLAVLEPFKKMYLIPDVGDMIIFNSGRIWHTIGDIEGENNRITIGGFLSRSRDNRKLYYWS